MFAYKRLVFICILLIPTQGISKILYNQESLYQRIIVEESNGLRCLFFSHKRTSMKHYQGCVYPSSPLAIPMPYSQALMASLLVKKTPKRVLVVGLGIGTVPMSIRYAEPQTFIESVEIDPDVLNVAKTLFYYQEDELTKTYVTDGRVFVKQALNNGIKYDLIILDAFNSEYIPEHLMTADFLFEVKDILKSDGIVLANTFSRSKLYDYESVTYEHVFGDFFNLKLDGESGNRIIIAAKNNLPDTELIRNNALHYAKIYWEIFGINVNDLLKNMENEKDWDKSVRVLTDEYSPVNLLQQSSNENVVRFFVFLEDSLRNNFVLTITLMLLSVTILIYGIIKFFDLLVYLRQRSVKVLEED